MTNHADLPGAEESACRGCGKRILWVQSEGQRIPLDPVAPTYALEIVSDSGEETVYRWTRANGKTQQEPVFVSHFATCSEANQFSRGAKTKGAKP